MELQVFQASRFHVLGFGVWGFGLRALVKPSSGQDLPSARSSGHGPSPSERAVRDSGSRN